MKQQNYGAYPDEGMSDMEGIAIWAEEIGGGAGRYLEYVEHSDYGPHSPKWHRLPQDDRGKFAVAVEDLALMEQAANSPYLSLALSQHTLCKVRAMMDNYHDTLPFSGSERRWFMMRYHNAEMETDGEHSSRVDLVESTGAELVVQGVHRHVEGAELFARLWSWRCSRGAYRYDGAHDECVLVLRAIEGLFERRTDEGVRDG